MNDFSELTGGSETIMIVDDHETIWERLDLLYEETEDLFKRVKATKDICELRNMINVGYLITRQALERKESRGLHYTIDYPKSPTTNNNEVW